MMDRHAVKAMLRGPMVPVLTILRDDLAIDHAAIRQNVQYLIDRGIESGNGVLLAVGAGGDFPMLSLDERKLAASTIAEAAGARVPVILGAQDTNVNHMIELARWAESLGAAAIQLSSGYYYPTTDETCLRLFQAVHDATRTIGIMVYNTPWEGFDMSLDLVERLLELPRCVALKWSTEAGGRVYAQGVARFAARVAVVDNQGEAVTNHMLGGAGYVTHLASVWPEHELKVWSLLQAGDYVAAQREIMARTWPWLDIHGKLWRSTGAESPTVKAALELCGRRGGPTRLTARSLHESERRELYEVLASIGVPDLQRHP
jgi:4-hydroxy-tetrahydrodipicolinate synthase